MPSVMVGCLSIVGLISRMMQLPSLCIILSREKVERDNGNTSWKSTITLSGLVSAKMKSLIVLESSQALCIAISKDTEEGMRNNERTYRRTYRTTSPARRRSGEIRYRDCRTGQNRDRTDCLKCG